MSSWEFLGGENENMWMLSEDGLRKLCGQYSIDDKGSKDDLIARLPPPPHTPVFPSLVRCTPTQTDKRWERETGWCARMQGEEGERVRGESTARA